MFRHRRQRRQEADGGPKGWICLMILAATLLATPSGVWAQQLRASLNLRPNMGLYKPGESVVIQFNGSGATIGWTLKITVKDEHETVLATHNHSIPSSTWSHAYTAPNAKLGFYRVYASLYNGSTEVVKLTHPNASRFNGYLTYAIVPDPAQRPASLPELQTFWGMHGGYFPEVGTDLFAFMGWRWTIGGWNWSRLSPNISDKFDGSDPPGQQWAWATDGAGGPWRLHNMPNLTEGGRPYGGSPDVYKPGTFAYNTGALRPEYEPDWVDFCEAVAGSWPGVYPHRTQRMYEVTWEPIPPWGYLGTPEDLVRLYELAYGAIKGVDPDAWVLGPTMGISNMGDLSRTFTNFDHGLGNYIDAFSCHTYMDTDNGWNLRPPELAGQPSLLRTMKNRLRDYMGRDIPLIGTEMGYRTRLVERNPTTQAVTNQPSLGTQPDLTPELQQARRLIRSNLMVLGEGWQMCIGFSQRDYPTRDTINNVHYWDWGLFYNLDTPSHGGYGPKKIGPKPIAPAFAAMTFLLESRFSTCDINWLGASIRGYAYEHYEDSEDVALALWDFDREPNAPSQVTIDTGVASVEVYDWMGNKTVESTSNGMLTVNLSKEPVYILGVDAELWGSERPDHNVARGKTVTVSSQAGGSTAGSLAVDGDSVSHLSRWVSASGFAQQWIEVDLGGSVEIDEVRFWTGEYSTGSNGPLGRKLYQLPLTAYRIQRWDNGGWMDIVNRSGNSNPVVVETFAPVTTSKVRLLVPASTVDAVKLYELEVMSTSEVTEPPVDDLVTLLPVADSQVRGGAYTGVNYGTATTMRARYDGPSSNETYEAFLRFDLSEISGTISEAKLVLHPTQVTIWQNAPANRLHRVGSDTWSETTITFNNKPGTDGLTLAEWTPVQGQAVEIDLTSVVLSEVAGDGVLSLRVHGVNWDGANVFYATREHGTSAFRPMLQVSVETPSFLVGDANKDGVVSADDFASIQQNFGATGPADGSLIGDANGDGLVSADDFASVQQNFGATAAGQ